uniref:Cytochrome P450 90B1 n=1 Tax=Fritillaria cirrhosa TaxID=108544 RepID=A0A1L7H7Y2_9LILI|nr:cytochrome P450 90B1 [Fritillaria cirrhosa]
MPALFALVGLFLTFLILAITALIVRGNHNESSNTKGLKLPPGSMGWPVIGDTIPFRKEHKCISLGDYLEGRVQKYGKIFRTHLFGHPTVVSTDAELNRFVFMNDEKLFEPFFPKSVADILGEHSMLVITGDIHRSVKSLASSFLGVPRLRNYFLKDIEQFITEAFNTWEDDVPFPIKEQTSKVTFKLIVKNILSMKPEDPRSEEMWKLFATFMKGLVAIPIDLPITKRGKAVRARKRILAIIKEMMEERIHKKEAGTDEIGDADILGYCLENSKQDAEQFGDLMLGILFGGHETSATAMTMSVYFLSDCPRAVEQLREEYQQIASKKKQRGEPAALTWEDYRQMEFSQCVISETLRLGNIIKTVHRRAKVDIQFKGYDIPRGWQVIPILTASHLDSEVYEKPLIFNPWRWQEALPAGNTARLDNYMPFGLGLRNCAGLELAKMEMVIFLYHFVLNFDWKMLNADPPVVSSIPEFTNGLPITVRRLSPVQAN